jgi:SulP family sulfate permease
MLAVATFGVLVTGPVIIGYIPIMVVGSLIFFLGFDLMREALVDTWGRVNRLEYLTASLVGLFEVLSVR